MKEHDFEWRGKRYRATDGDRPSVRCTDAENPYHLIQHAAPAEILRLTEENERLRKELEELRANYAVILAEYTLWFNREEASNAADSE